MSRLESLLLPYDLNHSIVAKPKIDNSFTGVVVLIADWSTPSYVATKELLNLLTDHSFPKDYKLVVCDFNEANILWGYLSQYQIKTCGVGECLWFKDGECVLASSGSIHDAEFIEQAIQRLHN